MRVGLVTTSYPRHENDIAGNFVRGFARSLTELGHTVDVLAPEPSEEHRAPSDPGITLSFVPYMRPRSLAQTFYGAGAPDNFTTRRLAILGAAPFIASSALHIRKRATNWDAVVSHWALPSALLVAHACPRLPHLAVMHSGDVHALSRVPLGALLARDVARRASALWFVSSALRDQFALLAGGIEGKHVITKPMGIVLPAPISAEERAQARARLGFTRTTVLMLSRLVPIKGVDVAIRALASDHDVDLVIAGDGPERATLESMANGRVRFVGEVRGLNKELLLRGSDLFVSASRTLPSGRTEGVPTAILEAMSYGLPVVATHTGGIADVVVDNENGLLIRECDENALAHAVREIAASSALRDKLANGANKTAREHSWSTMLPTIEGALRITSQSM